MEGGEKPYFEHQGLKRGRGVSEAAAGGLRLQQRRQANTGR